MDRVITTVPNGRVDRVVIVRFAGESWLHHPHDHDPSHVEQARDLVLPWECEALRADEPAA